MLNKPSQSLKQGKYSTKKTTKHTKEKDKLLNYKVVDQEKNKRRLLTYLGSNMNYIHIISVLCIVSIIPTIKADKVSPIIFFLFHFLNNNVLFHILKKCKILQDHIFISCLLYTSPSPRDKRQARMPSSA